MKVIKNGEIVAITKPIIKYMGVQMPNKNVMPAFEVRMCKAQLNVTLSNQHIVDRGLLIDRTWPTSLTDECMVHCKDSCLNFLLTQLLTFIMLSDIICRALSLVHNVAQKHMHTCSHYVHKLK